MVSGVSTLPNSFEVVSTCGNVSPEISTTVEVVPVLSVVSTRRSPDTTAPEGSVTVPKIVPRNVCAAREPTINAKQKKTAIAFMHNSFLPGAALGHASEGDFGFQSARIIPCLSPLYLLTASSKRQM